MKSFFSIKGLMTVAMMLTLTACAGEFAALPDDPNNEPVSKEGSSEEPSTSTPEPETPSAPAPVVPVDARAEILKQYNFVDPTHIVPTTALEDAIIYYHEKKATLKNPNVLSVLDFSQTSKNKRFYIINMKTGSVWNVHVSHGKGSDSNHDGYAEKFSNVEGSNASSLGYYKTAETYQGSNGYSLRLDGLSTTNSRARERAIVIHGASYVQDSNVIQGRSWGCPAISTDNHRKVIDMLKGGSIIYAFK
ncbi:murein L,D-transpeptidase catalytic domain family protein [Bdellovibrio reynosensis]|uniref:Murein L,D-transpeptidase catalytic domain family protein n=1 Tax=Bdellovibrio reynosensis TaxID=2835041 RepID=A0ABY4C447_9BACT|nr:murein L,D-transpeptidase catalytic domain family protein [Bdellovibrio reynosensis]UOE99741.1 murein L,D-transpeptidase catalytic domain family protein [Bdellovibrio reynosensis]